MTRDCQACTRGVLVLNEYASRGCRYDHYRCENPECRAGGIHNPRTGRRVGPVFEGRTPLAASIASQPTTTGSMELIQS